jgi:phosphotransferase system IIA component
VLIHVGIDTVNLKGEGFDVKVKNGDRVETGTPLVTFDRAVIEKAGYPLITPVIVLNGDTFDTVDPVARPRHARIAAAGRAEEGLTAAFRLAVLAQRPGSLGR